MPTSSTAETWSHSAHGSDAEPIEREVTAFIVRNFLFGAAQQAPAPEDSFLELGIIDSTGILELVAHLERTYRFKIGDDDLIPENLDSVRSVAAFVLRKTQR